MIACYLSNADIISVEELFILAVVMHHFLETIVIQSYYRCDKEYPLLCIYSLPVYSAVDCDDPGTPTNGQHSDTRTTLSYVVTYTCDNGYTLQGSNTRTCQPNGQWSGSVPQCIGMLVWVTGQINWRISNTSPSCVVYMVLLHHITMEAMSR